MKKLSLNEQKQIIGGKVYKCDLCDFTTKWYIRLGMHISAVHGTAGL